MKIVIISGAIYPRISPRSMRATELAKFFAAKGHDVSLYGTLEDFDYSSFENKYKLKVKNIGKRLFPTRNDKGEEKTNFITTILKKIFGRILEFPQIELAFLMPKIIKNEPNTDFLISIAIPYPIHWGLAWEKKKRPATFPHVWVSDCGDPYMGNSLVSHPKYFQRVENFWVEQTDFITIPIDEARSAYSSTAQPKIRIIPQAFNFNETPIDEYKPNKITTFIFAGICYKSYRDPSAFLSYLCSLKQDFKFIVYTKSQELFSTFKPILGNRLVINSYISREELIKKLSKADFLVNFKNSAQVQSPSKLIDYGISKRPIISIGSDFKEVDIFEEFMTRNYTNADIIDISNYDINKVGQQFLDLANCHK